MKKIATHYDVGFGKPPKETQFKKGQSGNPAGRPKGSQNKPKIGIDGRMKKLILDEAYREISINDERGQTDITIMEAAIRSLGIKAAKGDARSQKIFFDVVRDVEKRDELIYRELLENAVEYQDHWHQQIERCKAQGLPAPNPLPHPDHIHINYETGQVAIWGPVDKAEKKTFDSINALETKKNQICADLLVEDDPDERAHMEKLIQTFDDVIDNMLQKWRA